MNNIKVLNPNEATDNCPFPNHDWRLIGEGTWECVYCGAIGMDEDAILASLGVVPVQITGTIPAAATVDGKERDVI